MPYHDLRILCVEDDHDVGHIIRLALALDGAIETRIVADAPGALAEVNGGFQPDLLLLSDKLRGGRSADPRTSMRDELGVKPPPVIFLAANNRVADVVRLKAAESIGVIAKPFDPLNLARLIRSLIQCRTSTSAPA